MIKPILPILAALLSASPATFAQTPEKSPSDTLLSAPSPTNRPPDEIRQEGRRAPSVPAPASETGAIELSPVSSGIRELPGGKAVIPDVDRPAPAVPAQAQPGPPAESKAAIRFGITGRNVYHHGLGGYVSAEGKWTWTARKGWIAAGIMAGRRFLFMSPGGENMLGGTLETGWSITPRLGVRLHGQYLFLNGATPLPAATLPLPHTEAGGSLFYRIDGDTRIEGGYLHRFDDNRRQWNSLTGGKISIGF